MELTSGIPVIIGAGDDIESLGSGLIKSGDTLEHLGTTGSILYCSDKIVQDPKLRFEIYPHV
ncbi:unnamed protein product, partial [marine sediment metagenome]